MIERGIARRRLMRAAAVVSFVLISGCSMIPKTTSPDTTGPTTSGPSQGVLPTDTERHRVALLVPMSGENAAVGQSISNAATMALLDTNATNLRVTTYDTSESAGVAARKAIADGNQLILGPLLSDNIPAVAAQARGANIPLISFSNDERAASRNVYIMGNLPSQSVTRTVKFARSKGITTFAGLVPRGEYGSRASDALLAAARQTGSTVVAMETYDRSTQSIQSAAASLRSKGGYGAVLIADGGRMSAVAAPLLEPVEENAEPVKLMGTELWSGEKAVTSSPALRGAWYAAVSDNRFAQFSNSYRTRFGAQPYRIATLGYDAVLLSLRISRDWTPGQKFPVDRLTDSGGFLGLDGAFRFGRDGVVERSLEVREVRYGGVSVLSPAPSRFQD